MDLQEEGFFLLVHLPLLVDLSWQYSKSISCVSMNQMVEICPHYYQLIMFLLCIKSGGVYLMRGLVTYSKYERGLKLTF
jgi:hypothetical protein